MNGQLDHFHSKHLFLVSWKNGGRSKSGKIMVGENLDSDCLNTTAKCRDVSLQIQQAEFNSWRE